VAPAAAFLFSNPNDPISGNYNINCSNPLMSAQQALTLCTQEMIDADAAAIAIGAAPVTVNVAIGRRNVEGGGRSSDYEHSNYRAVLGGKGDINAAWSYDAYAQYYYTTFFTSNDQYMNFTAIDQALLVRSDEDGNPVCISGGRCVPWNIFQDGGVTQEQLDFLYLAGTGYGTTTLRTIHGEVSGQLGEYGLKLPSAEEGIAINVGYEHRNEHVEFEPDAGLASGQLSGFGSAAVGIDNSVSVDEAFVEVRVPLVQNRPGIEDLVFNTAYRLSDYSSTGRANTYKFETQYAPVESLRFRGSYQRAVRAPSVVELFNGALVGLIQLGDDPCSSPDGVTPAAATLEQCLNTVPAAEQAAFIQRRHPRPAVAAHRRQPRARQRNGHLVHRGLQLHALGAAHVHGQHRLLPDRDRRRRRRDLGQRGAEHLPRYGRSHLLRADRPRAHHRWTDRQQHRRRRLHRPAEPEHRAGRDQRRGPAGGLSMAAAGRLGLVDLRHERRLPALGGNHAAAGRAYLRLRRPVRQHLPDREPALAPQPARHLGFAVECRSRPDLAIHR
jgi:hypothetical protein